MINSKKLLKDNLNFFKECGGFSESDTYFTDEIKKDKKGFKMRYVDMTLLELSNILVNKGYPDLFDFQVDGDILDISSMCGSISDLNGDNTIAFGIVKVGDTDTFLDTVITIKKEYIK